MMFPISLALFMLFILFCIFFILWIIKNNQFKSQKLLNTDLTFKLALMERLQADLDKANVSIEILSKKNNDLSCELVKEKTEKIKLDEYLNERLKELSDLKISMKETLEIFSKQVLSENSNLLNTSFKKTLDEFFSHNEREKKQNSEQIVNVINPLKESLLLVDKKISDLEKLRSSAYSSLYEQIDSLSKSQNNLVQETSSLKASLNAPSIRGRWGEMQLKRVVELSGLSGHCDFLEQQSFQKDGETSRPDMIITLPQNKKIIIDAKAPLDSIFQSNHDALDEQKHLAQLVSTIRRHISSLSKKSYTKIVDCTPEFVIMFLPSEAILSRALLVDPSLIDFAAQNEIILATPLTLIAILKAVSFTFRQEAIAHNVEEVRKLSLELIERIHKVSEHFERLGKSLKAANESYDQTLKSLDSRVLVTARKIAQLRSFNNEENINKPQVKPLDIDSGLTFAAKEI